MASNNIAVLSEDEKSALLKEILIKMNDSENAYWMTKFNT
jgi:hypothetical protein